MNKVQKIADGWKKVLEGLLLCGALLSTTTLTGCGSDCAAGKACIFRGGTVDQPCGGNGASCAFECYEGADCHFSCPGGGCSLKCSGAKSCVMDCPGNSCAVSCATTGTCKVNTCTTGCALTCGGAQSCQNSCTTATGCGTTP